MKAYKGKAIQKLGQFTANDRDRAIAQFRRTHGRKPVDSDYTEGVDRHPLDVPQGPFDQFVHEPDEWKGEPLPDCPTHDNYGRYIHKDVRAIYDQLVKHHVGPSRADQSSLLYYSFVILRGECRDIGRSMLISYWRHRVKDLAKFHAFLTSLGIPE